MKCSNVITKCVQCSIIQTEGSKINIIRHETELVDSSECHEIILVNTILHRIIIFSLTYRLLVYGTSFAGG